MASINFASEAELDKKAAAAIAPTVTPSIKSGIFFLPLVTISARQRFYMRKVGRQHRIPRLVGHSCGLRPAGREMTKGVDRDLATELQYQFNPKILKAVMHLPWMTNEHFTDSLG